MRRRSRRQQNLPPEPIEEVDDINDDIPPAVDINNDIPPAVVIHSQIQDPIESGPNSNEEKKSDVDCVPNDQIPDNVDDDWIGFDKTGRYIITSDGTIHIDAAYATSNLPDAETRNKKYHNHKKYVIKNVCTTVLTRSVAVLHKILFCCNRRLRWYHELIQHLFYIQQMQRD